MQYGFVTLGLPLVVCVFGLGVYGGVIVGHLWVVLLICVGVGLAVFVLWDWWLRGLFVVRLFGFLVFGARAMFRCLRVFWCFVMLLCWV